MLDYSNTNLVAMTKTNESSDTEIQQGEEQVVDTALPQQQQQQQQSGGPDITPHLRGDPLDMDDLSDDDSTVVQENQQNGNGTNNYNSSAKQKDSSNEKKHHEMGRLLYNWRLYFPKRLTLGNIIRWFMGNADQKGVKQTDEEMMKNLRGLARCLVLLREYLDTFGMPEKGGHRDQCRVLGEIASDLYAGGTPMWALEPVLKRCAEGLGQAHVQWQLFPRKCFMYNPTIGSTAMFKMDRGFNISKMDAMEPVVLRLCSFASNVEGVNNIPSRFPDPREFNILARQETGRTSGRVREDPKKLADKILSLSSRREGVLYFVNSQEYSKHLKQTQTNASNATFDDFWIVSDEERELFTRLACQEAMDMISEIDKEEEKKHFLHSKSVLMFFRGCASAGACAFWFDGSFQDMLVAGFLAILIALIGASSVLSKQERVVFEVVASFVVGLVAGAVALTWPDDTCFSAMGLAAVLDIMQGFKVVFAVIEVLSKHTMSGTADLIEGVLMTSLVCFAVDLI